MHFFYTYSSQSNDQSKSQPYAFDRRHSDRYNLVRIDANLQTLSRTARNTRPYQKRAISTAPSLTTTLRSYGRVFRRYWTKRLIDYGPPICIQVAKSGTTMPILGVVDLGPFLGNFEILPVGRLVAVPVVIVVVRLARPRPVGSQDTG